MASTCEILRQFGLSSKLELQLGLAFCLVCLELELEVGLLFVHA